jgi:4-hydroxybenzoate polyprenyltransferase
MARPFTLLPPMLGMASGAMMAWGSDGRHFERALRSPWLFILLGAALAGIMNAGSNMINQVTDLDIDRMNKPDRPLPSGRAALSQARWGAGCCYALSLVLAGLIGIQCFAVALGGTLCSLAYSVEPLRLKRYGWGANGIIALARGCLLKVCGWACLADIRDPEPWAIGAIFFLFLLGATTSKDYADMKGDSAQGVRSLPVVYGPVKAAWITAPFFILPWLLIPLGNARGLWSGNPALLGALGLLLAIWGGYVTYLILRDPTELSRSENHPSWRHMYLMMMAAQLGLGAAYLL